MHEEINQVFKQCAPKNVALTSHQFMQQRGLLVDELQHLPLNTPWPSHFIPPSEFKIQPTIEPHYPSLKSDQQTSKTFQDMKSNQYDDEDVNEILIFFENIKEDEWMNLLQDKVSRFTCEETIKTVVKVEELKEIKDRGIEIEIDKSKKIKEGVRKRLKKIKIQNPEGIEIDLRINNKEEKKQGMITKKYEK